MSDSIAELEQRRAGAARDQAEAKRAHDAAVRDAARRGDDPQDDFVVRRYATASATAQANYTIAREKHHAKLDAARRPPPSDG